MDCFFSANERSLWSPWRLGSRTARWLFQRTGEAHKGLERIAGMLCSSHTGSADLVVIKFLLPSQRLKVCTGEGRVPALQPGAASQQHPA